MAMKRPEKEIQDFERIVGVIKRADTLRLGISAGAGEAPYVVPLSFGFEAEDGKIALYIHGAKEGLKHELIRENPNVCVEISSFHGYLELPNGRGITTKYESVIGFGKAEIVEGAEAIKGLDLICEHCEFPGFEYGGEACLATCRVYKIALESFSGKTNIQML